METNTISYWAHLKVSCKNRFGNGNRGHLANSSQYGDVAPKESSSLNFNHDLGKQVLWLIKHVGFSAI